MKPLGTWRDASRFSILCSSGLKSKINALSGCSICHDVNCHKEVNTNTSYARGGCPFPALNEVTAGVRCHHGIKWGKVVHKGASGRWRAARGREGGDRCSSDMQLWEERKRPLSGPHGCPYSQLSFIFWCHFLHQVDRKCTNISSS